MTGIGAQPARSRSGAPWVWAALGGLLIALALTAPTYTGAEGLRPAEAKTAFQSLYAVYCQCVSSNALLTGVLTAVFAAALYMTRSYRRPLRPALAVCGALFGVIEVLALHMDVHDGLAFAFGNVWYGLFSLVHMAGWAVLFCFLGSLLYRLYDSGVLCRQRPAPGRLLTLWDRRAWACAFIAILICWLPWLILYYPGSVPYDAAAQLQQFTGFVPMTADHPVLSTWLIGSFFSFGRLLGSDGLGIFLYCLMQSVLCAAVYAGVVRFIKNCGGSRTLQLCVLAFYALTPMFWGFAMCSYKDTLFCGLFVLFVLMSVSAFRFPETYQEKPLRLAAYGLVGLLACLIRNNGAFAVLPTMLAVALAAFRGKLRAGALAALALTAALFAGFHIFTSSVLEIPSGSVSELMSVPFQQTARYVRDHGDEVTEEERAAIDRVLDYDSLAESYRPGLSDPVKQSWKKPDADALSAYWRVWRRMGAKRPGCYFEATLANTYGYYAFTRAVEAKPRIEAGMEQELLEPAGLDIRYAFEDADWPRARYLDLFFYRIPVLSLVTASAAHTWLMLLSAAYLARRRRTEAFAAVLPLFIILLSCLVMPVNDYMRYYMPVMAAMPLLLCLTATGSRESAVDCKMN